MNPQLHMEMSAQAYFGYVFNRPSENGAESFKVSPGQCQIIYKAIYLVPENPQFCVETGNEVNLNMFFNLKGCQRLRKLVIYNLNCFVRAMPVYFGHYQLYIIVYCFPKSTVLRENGIHVS